MIISGSNTSRAMMWKTWGRFYDLYSWCDKPSKTGYFSTSQFKISGPLGSFFTIFDLEGKLDSIGSRTI